MSSRDAILHRIRTASPAAPAAAIPPVPEVWPRQTSDKGLLAEQFTAELKAVFGEPIRCRSMAEAQQQLAQLDARPPPGPASAPWIAPRRGNSTAAMPPDRVNWVDASWNPTRIAQLPVGLVAADVLLADTGSCVIACGTTHSG